MVGLKDYFVFYNGQRQSLKNKSLDDVYRREINGGPMIARKFDGA